MLWKILTYFVEVYAFRDQLFVDVYEKQVKLIGRTFGPINLIRREERGLNLEYEELKLIMPFDDVIWILSSKYYF